MRDTNDSDNDPTVNDDNGILDYGHAASQVDNRAIAMVVKRYYKAGASEDGVSACRLIYGLVAETIPEDFSQTTGLRGKTCAAVMSHVFKQHHQQFVTDIAALEVTGVRVAGTKAYAIVYFGQTPEPYVTLHRESGVWKMESLFENRLP